MKLGEESGHPSIDKLFIGNSEGQTIPNKTGQVPEKLPLPGPGVPWELQGRFGAIGPGGAPRATPCPATHITNTCHIARLHLLHLEFSPSSERQGDQSASLQSSCKDRTAERFQGTPAAELGKGAQRVNGYMSAGCVGKVGHLFIAMLKPKLIQPRSGLWVPAWLK